MSCALALLVAPDFAQARADAVGLLDPVGARPLRWSEWLAFHQRLGERLDSGRLTPATDAVPVVQDARAALRDLIEHAGDFSRLSPREADALVAAHSRLVGALGLGDVQLMHCAQRQPLGSRRGITECRTVGANAEARERARAGLLRLGTLPAVDG